METREQSNGSDQSEVQTQEVGESQEEKKFVPVDAYKEVSSDMHKFKSRYREAEAKANELAERIKQIEEEKLKEQNRYKELYERERAEKEQTLQERQREKELYLRSVKLSALKSELGGKVRDEFLSFANIDSIELREDGTLSSESVQNVANSFRKDYPELIAKDSSVNITGSPAAQGVVNKQSEKTLSQMTTDEKVALLQQKKLNRS